MTTLLNFPFVGERTPITGDGLPSENAGLDCVPASLCAACMYLNNIHAIGGDFTPDSLKDKAYGQGYVGGTAASDYVNVCASLGIRLSPYRSTDTSALVKEAHRQIRLDHPVIYTEPNPYGNPAYTHVCVFYAEGDGYLKAMDPWIAGPVTCTDAMWTSLLLDNEIWILERMSTTPINWRDDGTTLLAPNGVPVKRFRSYILTHAWDPQNWPLEPESGHPVLEDSNPTLGGGTRQTFRMSMLEWTPDRGVFIGWIGQELIKVRAELAAK